MGLTNTLKLYTGFLRLRLKNGDPREYDRHWEKFWKTVNKTGQDAHVVWDARPDIAAAEDLPRFQSYMDRTVPILDLGCGNGRQSRYLSKYFDTVIGAADFVVIASASTMHNRHLLGESQLRLMRRDAFLINVARGEIVDEAALIRALQERRIAGAALDVFEREPLPADSPLWKLDNVILSPHIAGITPRYDDHMAGLFAENLRRYLAGEPLLNLVDRNRGY